MNNVSLIGRIVNDLEVRNVGQDLSVLSFTVALNERRNGQDESHFFDITAWNKQAETIAQYFRKGQRIGLSGKLRQEKWKDKDGSNRSRVSIVLREFYFIEPKDGGGGSGGYTPAANQAPPSNQPKKNSMDFDDFPNDNIPMDGEVPF